MTWPEIDVCNKIASQAMSDPYVKKWLKGQNLKNKKY